MSDCDDGCLGRCADGFVKNDKVTELAQGNAFAFAKLLFGNAPEKIRSFPRKRASTLVGSPRSVPAFAGTNRETQERGRTTRTGSYCATPTWAAGLRRRRTLLDCHGSITAGRMLTRKPPSPMSSNSIFCSRQINSPRAWLPVAAPFRPAPACGSLAASDQRGNRAHSGSSRARHARAGSWLQRHIARAGTALPDRGIALKDEESLPTQEPVMAFSGNPGGFAAGTVVVESL